MRKHEKFIIENDLVSKIFSGYEKSACEKLLLLRKLILETAAENNLQDQLEETLKWQEPSYISKIGSTIRIAPYKKDKAKVAVFFNCKTVLIETIKELYKDLFEYEGNRALVFTIADSLPTKELKHCIRLALTYHRIKKRPLLGC